MKLYLFWKFEYLNFIFQNARIQFFELKSIVIRYHNYKNDNTTIIADNSIIS